MGDMLCLGITEHGELCTKRATKSGYCRGCDPSVKRLPVVSQKETQAELARRKKQIEAERTKAIKFEQSKEIMEQELANMIQECQSLEDLRKLELKVIQALISGKIDDPRVGSPIVQLLKHQEVLIEKKEKEGDDLKPNEREKMEAMAKEMSVTDMLQMIGDWSYGMKKLVKQAKIESADVVDVEVEDEHLAIEASTEDSSD